MLNNQGLIDLSLKRVVSNIIKQKYKSIKVFLYVK